MSIIVTFNGNEPNGTVQVDGVEVAEFHIEGYDGGYWRSVVVDGANLGEVYCKALGLPHDASMVNFHQWVQAVLETWARNQDFTEARRKARFLQLADAIEANASSFCLSTFVNTEDGAADSNYGFDISDEDGYPIPPSLADVLIHTCGTTACVGGWAAALSGVDIDAWSSYELAGREWLDLTVSQKDRLFFWDRGSVWTQFAEQFKWDVNAYGAVLDEKQITARQAAYVLRAIANGEVTL